MISIGKNRKGNVGLELVVFLIVLFACAIGFFVGNIFINEVNADAQTDADLQNLTKDVLNDWNTDYPTLFDNAFLTIFILMWVLTLVAAFKIDSHPLFLAITLMILVMILVVSVYMGNAYEDVVSDSDFTTITPNYPKANWIMSHLLVMAILIGASIALVLYGKNKIGGGGGGFYG